MSIQKYPKTRGIAISALFAAILGVASVIEIPIPISPVPITLQVAVVFLIATLLGPRYGTLSCLIYLLFGSVGLPVFAGASAGIGVILGPTGGYLVGFPVAALVGGTIARKVSTSRRLDLIRTTLGVVAALAIIYILGVVWLAEYLKMGLMQATLVGAVPFIGVDVAKALLTIPLAQRLRRTRIDLPVHLPRTRQEPTANLAREPQK